VAEVVVHSLLPEHLTTLNVTRTVRYAGSTQKLSALYETISDVTGHPISVKYTNKEESYARQRPLGIPVTNLWLPLHRLSVLLALVRRQSYQTTTRNTVRYRRMPGGPWFKSTFKMTFRGRRRKRLIYIGRKQTGHFIRTCLRKEDMKI